MILMNPEHTEDDLERLTHNIRRAALEADGQSRGTGQVYR